MSSLCGADCSACFAKDRCKGCTETGGSPLGGTCVAYHAICKGCLEETKEALIKEINALGIARVEKLYCLLGEYVNLAYPLPGGESACFLKPNDVYFGTRVEGKNACIGVVCNEDFILMCTYEEMGRNPQLLLYKTRQH